MAVAAPPDLRAFLDGPHAHVRARVREWLADNPPRHDLSLEEHRAQVLEWATELAGRGETVAGYPREYGGEDDLGGYVSGFETLGFGDLSLLVKVGVQFGLFGGAVLHLGTRRHHEAYLRDIASVALPGCFAMTEGGHGSDVQHVRTTATYEDGGFTVHTPTPADHKAYIGNAARDGRMAAVFAQLIVGGENRGVHALLVPIRDELGTTCDGVRIEDCGPKLGLDGVDNGRIWFDRVQIPRENLLDRFATVSEEGVYHSDIESSTKRFFSMLGTLIQGRVSVCGASINASKVALTIAVRHAGARRQFGPPDGDEVTLLTYRTHQRRLLPRLADAYALHFAQERLVATMAERFGDEGERGRELETMAAALKAAGTWHATATIQECREACGGQGYLKANRLAALKADTDVFTTFEGDNTVLLQLVAKNLLTGFKHEFEERDAFGTAAFFAGQVFEAVAERSALRELVSRIGDDLIPGRDDEGNLLERESQLAAVRWREEHVLASLARRLRGGLADEDADPFELLIACQDHLILAARAYADRLILEAFADAVERAPEEHRAVLGRLCDLHALHLFERERGWFQEHGRFSSTRSKAVIKAVNTLCGELAPHARALVDGFGVPESCLAPAATIAGGT